MNNLKSFPNLCRSTLIAGVLVGVSPVSAEPPMWVIEDTNSTIYLFGTVHMLQPDQEWFTASVQAALARADEVWFEIPMLESRQAMQAQLAPVFMRAALSPAKPLSSQLNAGEKEQLAAAIARSAHPQQLAMAVEKMKPWFAIVQLAKGPFQASGYDSEIGMEAVLSRAAHEKGIPVRGLETFEQQIGHLAGGSDIEQLAALRTLLSTPDATVRLENMVGNIAIGHWLDGDPALLDLLMGAWRDRPYPQRAPISYARMIQQRNADWTRQIEELLAGHGVAFIAVGAGHLVGPDSVRDMLAARGIEALHH